MAEDSELIMDVLREAREWAEIDVGPKKAVNARIHLARINAEIARRIPQQGCDWSWRNLQFYSCYPPPIGGSVSEKG